MIIVDVAFPAPLPPLHFSSFLDFLPYTFRVIATPKSHSVEDRSVQWLYKVHVATEDSKGLLGFPIQPFVLFFILSPPQIFPYIKMA